jgi:hypothetical protein
MVHVAPAAQHASRIARIVRPLRRGRRRREVDVHIHPTARRRIAHRPIRRRNADRVAFSLMLDRLPVLCECPYEIETLYWPDLWFDRGRLVTHVVG